MGIIKVGEIVLCDLCQKWDSARYDFNKRCCKARHLISIPKSKRLEMFESVKKEKGHDASSKLIDDVNRMWEYGSGIGFGQRP